MASERRNDVVVNHTSNLVKNIAGLHLNDQYSDITLKVERQSIRAHKAILASRSQYFSALLYGGLKETSSSEIDMSFDTPLVAFDCVLEYIYTGEMNLSTKTEDQLLGLLVLADKYGLPELQKSTSDFVKRYTLSFDNVIKIYNFSESYNLSELKEECYIVMDTNATQLFKSTKFQQLSVHGFKSVFSRDSSSLDEKHKFMAANEWIKGHPDISVEDRELILCVVQLQRIFTKDLIEIVRPTDLFPVDVIFDAINMQHAENEYSCRKHEFKGPTFNVIVSTSNYKVGLRVRRGKDWKWDAQDHNNGIPGVGSIMDQGSNELVPVKWDNGTIIWYCIGRNGKFDLYIA